MGFNSGKIKVQSSAKKKTKNDAWKNDVVVDPRGQWARPGEVTKVPSGNITMQGVPYPVMGVDEYGNQQLMMPGGEYMFPGNMVTEYPMMQMGGMTVKPRQGVRPNSNGTESTHLMRREYVPNRGWVAFPSLFQNDDGQWVDLGSQYGDQWKPIYDEAIKRGEVYDFGEDEKAAIDFADKGSWKKQVGGQAPDPYFQQLENINQYQQQLATERERVDLATQNLLTQAERKDVSNIPTRTNLGWIQQGKYFCNSHTCELMSDAGYTTQEGKPQPLIPGNMQMKGNLEKYGFVPVQQSQWKPGDFVQEELYKTRDYQGNEFSPRWVPSHSTIYSGTDEKGERYYYNAPGGARSDYANTPVHGHGVEGKDWRMKGYRYVGNMPQYEQQIADAQAKLRTLSPQKIAPIEASIPVPQQVPQLARAPESTMPEMSRKDAKNYLKQLAMSKDNLPPGYHMMPNGSIMADLQMDYRKGGQPCYECGGKVHYQDGGLTDYENYVSYPTDPSLIGRLKQVRPSLSTRVGQGINRAAEATRWAAAYPYHMFNIGMAGTMANALDSKARTERKFQKQLAKDELKGYQQGGNWMQDIKSTGQCTGKNFGGPNCRPGTRQYAFAKRARSGEFNKQFGGNHNPSVALQNTTTDSVGQAKVDLMKNFMTANTYKAMLDKEAERIEGIMQDGGSIYNPNTRLQQMYADDIAQQQQQFKKDWKVFGDAFAQTAMANQKPVQQPVQQQVKQEMDPSFAQYTDAMPNTGFGSGQSDYSFGQNYDHSFGRGTFGQGGAYLPMAQSGANLRANVPIPTAEQRAAQLAGLNYDVLAKPWIAAGDPTKMAQFRQEYPNVPTFSDISGSKDVATGYWDRVADWWGRKETPGYFSPQDEEEIMQDPRMSEAARKLLFQSPEATNMFDYAQTLFLTPQNMMNKVLTGYYESPGTTLQRYYPDMSTNSKVATDIFTDPLIVKSLVGKGLMQIPKIGTALKPYVVKAGELAKKYGKEAAEFAATYGKKGFIKSVEAAEKLAEYYAKNPWLQNVTEEVAMKIPQALMHMPKDDESKQAHLEAQMRAKIMKEMGTPQVMPSTRQGQVPQVNVQPVSQDPFSHMSTEEMEAILGARKYGGDTPKYQEAGNVPIMMQPYYSPETRQAMGMALANRRAQALMNPQFFPASGQQTTTPWTPPTISLSDADIANANILLQGPNTPEAALARRFGINPNYQQMYANDPTISSAANAARAGDAGATKKKVATTKKEQEQQARAEAEGAGTTTDPNKKRGNVPADETGKETTTTTDGKTVQTAHAPGYGGGRFKMKGRDPITGKRFKVKYDTRYSPREFYGGRGPRVVKYDIYNNPVYTDAYMNENYGPDAVTPEEQAIVDNAAMADAVPGWVTDPVGYKTPPPMDAGMGVLATVPSPYALGYGPWSPDPNAEVNQYAETLSTYDDPNAPGMGGGAQGRGRGIFGGGRQRGVNPARSNRIERRFQRQLARDEARGYQQGGGLWGDQQPLIYPGGMPDPNLNAAPYFQDGGGIFGWNPFGSASTDDEAYATGDVVDGKLAVTRSDARQMRRDSRPDAKAKWKGDNSGINQWAPMLPAAGHLTASIIEGIDPFGKNKKREAQFEAMHRADAVFTPNTQRDLGKHTVNQGYFDPYNMVPVQFPGMDQGAWGTPDTFAQYGGQYGTPQEMQMMPDSVAGPGGYGTMGEYRMANPDVQRGWMEWAESLQGQRPAQPQQPQRPQAQVLQPRTGIPPRPVNPGMYQQGGEMYLDENEIAQILAMGGQVEYV